MSATISLRRSTVLTDRYIRSQPIVRVGLPFDGAGKATVDANVKFDNDTLLRIGGLIVLSVVGGVGLIYAAKHLAS